MGFSYHRSSHAQALHGNPRRKNRTTLATGERLNLKDLRPVDPQPYTLFCNHHDDPCLTREEHKTRGDRAKKTRKKKEPKVVDPRHYCNHSPLCESEDAHRILKHAADAPAKQRLKEARERLFGQSTIKETQ